MKTFQTYNILKKSNTVYNHWLEFVITYDLKIFKWLVSQFWNKVFRIQSCKDKWIFQNKVQFIKNDEKHSFIHTIIHTIHTTIHTIHTITHTIHKTALTSWLELQKYQRYIVERSMDWEVSDLTCKRDPDLNPWLNNKNLQSLYASWELLKRVVFIPQTMPSQVVWVQFAAVAELFFPITMALGSVHVREK